MLKRAAYPYNTVNGKDFLVRNFGLRFHFNGKENDNELIDWQDYGERMYMKRLGRFPTPDPLIVKGQKYPELSPYQFAGNTPIQAIDLDGLEPYIPTQAFAFDGIRQPYNDIETNEWAIEGATMFGKAFGTVILFAMPFEELAVAGFGKAVGLFGKNLQEVVTVDKVISKVTNIEKAVTSDTKIQRYVPKNKDGVTPILKADKKGKAIIDDEEAIGTYHTQLGNDRTNKYPQRRTVNENRTRLKDLDFHGGTDKNGNKIENPHEHHYDENGSRSKEHNTPTNTDSRTNEETRTKEK